jgi:hypothetical protein
MWQVARPTLAPNIIYAGVELQETITLCVLGNAGTRSVCAHKSNGRELDIERYRRAAMGYSGSVTCGCLLGLLVIMPFFRIGFYILQACKGRA